MKIECTKEKLEEVLVKAGRIAGKNATLPVLSGLHLSTGENVLNIRATNLDLGISLSMPVKVIEPGTVVVPAQTITSLISSIDTNHTITFTVKDAVLNIKTRTVNANINTLPSEDFPLIPEINEDQNFSILSRDLVFGLKSVTYAAAVGSMKPELSSILITHEGEFLVFAATDSFRLAEKRIKIKKAPYFKQILVPQKNALEIIRTFDRGEEEVSIAIEEHQAAFRAGEVYLTSRLIEGNFPDYRQIIPKETVSKAIILKQDLLNSLKTSLIFSDSFNQLTLRISPKKSSFEIESKNNTVGENTYSLEAALEGEEITINVNHRYFIDCFQSIAADSVALSFSGEQKPILVAGVGDTSFLYLVMPMNRS